MPTSDATSSQVPEGPRGPSARTPGHSKLTPPPPAPGSTGAVGLLEYVTAHALDDDYQAAQREPDGRQIKVLSVVVIAAFVVLLITAATQTSRNSVSDAAERADLAGQVTARQNELTGQQHRITRLTATNNRLNAALAGNEKLSGGMRAQLTTLGVLAGTSAVAGPGLVVTVDDAPDARSSRQTVLDTDLQQLVNGLWAAGAEAIAINGERITALTAIRQAGQAITVNYVDLTRPYVVSAIGNPATMPTRFADTANGQTWLDLHQQVGLRFDVTASQDISVPAAQPVLRSASVPKGGSS